MLFKVEVPLIALNYDVQSIRDIEIFKPQAFSFDYLQKQLALIKEEKSEL